MTSYFDLRASPERNRERDAASIPVIPQYIALALGVIVEPFVHEFIKSRMFHMSWSALSLQLLFGLIIAVLIFPAVYRNSFDPKQPLFVQLCAIFASGVGWQSLFSAATSGNLAPGPTATNTVAALTAPFV